MLCKKVELCNFRNAESQKITFTDGINVLHGENAQGKTNLLEAIYFISLGKSFRTSHEVEVIRFGEQYASISLDYESAGRTQNITMRFSDNARQKKNVTHNGVKITKLSELVGSFRAVLFSPDHLQMIKDGPSLRRNYLDVAISQIRPMYLHSLQKYNKILKKNLEEQKETDAKRTKEDEAIQKIVDKSKMDIPEAMIKTQCEDMVNEMAQRLSQSGIPMEQYLQMTGQTVDGLMAQARPEAEKRIKTSLVLEAIVKDQNIEVTDEDVAAEIEKMPEMYRAYYASEYAKEYMKRELAITKAVEYIMANVKEKAAKKAKKDEAEVATEE